MILGGYDGSKYPSKKTTVIDLNHLDFKKSKTFEFTELYCGKQIRQKTGLGLSDRFYFNQYFPVHW